MQIAQIQAYSYECTPCSDAISGPKDRVFDIKSGHDFCRYRNSIQVIYFQISGAGSRVNCEDVMSLVCHVHQSPTREDTDRTSTKQQIYYCVQCTRKNAQLLQVCQEVVIQVCQKLLQVCQEVVTCLQQVVTSLHTSY